MLDMAGSLSLSDDFEILSINSQVGSDIDWEGEYHLSDDDFDEELNPDGTSDDKDTSKLTTTMSSKRNSKNRTKKNPTGTPKENSEDKLEVDSKASSEESPKESTKGDSKQSSHRISKGSSKKRPSSSKSSPSTSSTSKGNNTSKAEQLALYMEAIDDEDDDYSNDENDEDVNDNDISDFDESDLSQRLRPSNFSLVFPDVNAALNLSSTGWDDESDTKLDNIEAFLLLGSSPHLEVIGHQLVDACKDKMVLQLFESGKASVVYNNDDLIDGEVLKAEPKAAEQQFERFRNLNSSQIVLVKILDDENSVSALTMFSAKSKLGIKFISSQLLEISKDCTEWVLDGFPIPNALNTTEHSRNARFNRKHVVSHLTNGFLSNIGIASPSFLSLFYALCISMGTFVILALLTSLYLNFQNMAPSSPVSAPDVAPNSNLPAVVLEAENSLSNICVQSKDAIAWLLSMVESYLRQYVKEATKAARGAHETVKAVYGDGIRTLRLFNQNSCGLYDSMRTHFREAIDAVKELKV